MNEKEILEQEIRNLECDLINEIQKCLERRCELWRFL